MADDVGVDPVVIRGGKYLSVAQALEVLQIRQQSLTERVARGTFPGEVIEIPLLNRRTVFLLALEGVQKLREERERRLKRKEPRARVGETESVNA